MRIICVLRSLLHCALFSAPTAYYLLALTCNCIDLQYTTRPGPTHARWIFFLFSRMYPDLPGNGSLLRLAPRDGTTTDATLRPVSQHVTIFLQLLVPTPRLIPFIFNSVTRRKFGRNARSSRFNLLRFSSLSFADDYSSLLFVVTRTMGEIYKCSLTILEIMWRDIFLI